MIKELLISEYLALDLVPVFSNEEDEAIFFEEVLLAKIKMIMRGHEITMAEISEPFSPKNNPIISYKLGASGELNFLVKKVLEQFLSVITNTFANTIYFREHPKVYKNDKGWNVAYRMVIE